MAAGDTDVSICNKALLLLGAENINSFSDGTASAVACSTIYNEVKKIHARDVSMVFYNPQRRAC